MYHNYYHFGFQLVQNIEILVGVYMEKKKITSMIEVLTIYDHIKMISNKKKW